jgi:hypothetical protein
MLCISSEIESRNVYRFVFNGLERESFLFVEERLAG